MYNYLDFLLDCHLIFTRLHAWHASVEFKNFNNLYRKHQKLPLSSKL